MKLMHAFVAFSMLATFMLSGCSAGKRPEPEGTGVPAQVRTLEQELTELAAMQPSGDVDPALFAELKASLAAALGGPAGRIASGVPQGAAGAVTDLHFSATGDGLLRWTYVNRGDYDQNSEVNAADIVPIAAHYGKTTASPDWAAAQVADGDGNGEINGADIVPIAGNFRGTVEGYRIEVSADGTGGWSSVADVPFSSSAPEGAWRMFNEQLAAPVHGQGYRVVPFADGASGALSNAVQYAAPIWLTLAVDTTDLVGEFTSLAVVNGKPAISYFDTTNADLKYAYSSTADGSNIADWTAIPVDTAGTVGMYTSLAVVNGKPAISYYDHTNGNLKYAYSSTADGSSGWTTIAVDTPGLVGRDTSLAVVNGYPAISYNDGTNTALKYAYSTSLDGSSGWTAIHVDTLGHVGTHTSLAVINGKPAISYYATTNSALKYAYSSTVDGSNAADWTTIAVDTGGNVGWFTSLADVNGKPAISYYDPTNLDLKFAYSSTTDGSSDWTAIAVDTTGNVGYFTSLAVVNGKPAISYYDSTNTDLKYAYSSAADGSSGWTAIAVDTDGDVGGFTSLAVVNGQPAISYTHFVDLSNMALKYAVLMP